MPNGYDYTDLNYADPYAVQRMELQRQQELADALRTRSREPIQRVSVGGFQGQISPFSGLAKMLESYSAEKAGRKVTEDTRALSAKRVGDRRRLLDHILNTYTGGGVGQTDLPVGVGQTDLPVGVGQTDLPVGVGPSGMEAQTNLQDVPGGLEQNRFIRPPLPSPEYHQRAVDWRIPMAPLGPEAITTPDRPVTANLDMADALSVAEAPSAQQTASAARETAVTKPIGEAPSAQQTASAVAREVINSPRVADTSDPQKDYLSQMKSIATAMIQSDDFQLQEQGLEILSNEGVLRETYRRENEVREQEFKYELLLADQNKTLEQQAYEDAKRQYPDLTPLQFRQFWEDAGRASPGERLVFATVSWPNGSAPGVYSLRQLKEFTESGVEVNSNNTDLMEFIRRYSSQTPGTAPADPPRGAVTLVR